MARERRSLRLMKVYLAAGAHVHCVLNVSSLYLTEPNGEVTLCLIRARLGQEVRQACTEREYVMSPIWLTPQAHELLQEELSALIQVRSRRSSAVFSTAKGRDDSWDISTEHQSLINEQDRNRRIRCIQEMLIKSVVGREVPDDGVAEPGMLLTVLFETDSEAETFLLANRAGAAHSDTEICSPESPLGQTLCGAREGEFRQYRLPNGRAMMVQLIRAVPYLSRGLSGVEADGSHLHSDTSASGSGGASG